MIVVLPDLVLVGGFGLGEIGKAAFPLVMLGLLWGLMLVVLAPFLLFHEPGPNAGPSDSDGGPGPENRPPAPPLPVGWIPLPDAEQSPIRTRGPSRGRLSPHPRRSREPKPGPSRIRLLR
jgi:hypothetical protein